MRDLLQKNIETFGANVIVTKAIEEMSELTKELCKALTGSDRTDRIAEELADVEITLEELHIIFGDQAFEYEVRKWKELKLERQKNRIEMSDMRGKAGRPETEQVLLSQLCLGD